MEWSGIAVIGWQAQVLCSLVYEHPSGPIAGQSIHNLKKTGSYAMIAVDY
jgi:hypothetical protein